ncbi:DNA mismatch repair protein MutT [Candidatus Nomurabacteria bacterium RIFCSPHIGHO2_02_FULL_36_29]|uniref:DNA mismatch repair protein MutT n=1 Tax=Candidatus Nomurabacteria bacterium RIFCSPLOWO2_01_FULL_36_16 TaxID=1801767 RepID=A0A1F6WY26_9BACT|nr:MAG: DNA mismatch repair protein MutT [Candidatus Nomurabacteria bacterium RIFCSPHIGHO2_02_FULL_36_29]OGI86635.1 MAG: DNA mismatch repair protein MutT [Candidatus Nomurabacteria bacterium RIFCSPLOWO2_01_FULL_36_16]
MKKTYIDTLALVELKDRKVLETKSSGRDTWYIPGGKRDAGETDEQTLIREVKEELNVDIDSSTIIHYGTFEAQAHGKPEGTVVKMTCYQAKYSGELFPSTEIEKIDWFDYSKKELTSPVDHLLFDDLKAKDLID